MGWGGDVLLTPSAVVLPAPGCCLEAQVSTGGGEGSGIRHLSDSAACVLYSLWTLIPCPSPAQL